MKPAAWLAIGGVAALATVGAVLLTRKRTEVPPPLPPKTYGELVKVTLPVPSGWRRATAADVSALPELRTRANALRSTPGFTLMVYGTLAPFVASDGKTYATWIEQHFHPPGGDLQPWGLHHGVTLLAAV